MKLTPEQVKEAIEQVHKRIVGRLESLGDLSGEEMYELHLGWSMIGCYDENCASAPPLMCMDGVGTYDDQKGAAVIAMADDGDVAADAVLCAIASIYIDESCPLPPNLGDYYVRRNCNTQPPSRRKGRKPHRNYCRDSLIASQVELLVSRGLFATRNFATRNEPTEAPSACSLVSAALQRAGIKVSERTVEDVWANWRAIS